MKKNFSARGIALMGMLAAIAALLTLIDFPIPFIAPSFYKFDFSEVPVLIGAFAMGPVAGIIIELVKILLNLLLNGTSTAYVGEIANFVMGLTFIFPASIIYHFKTNKKGAFIGLGVGTVTATVASALLNAFVLIPTYVKLFGMSMDTIVKMGNAIFSSVTNETTFVLLCVAPFNLIKFLVSALITALLYKKVSFVIKDFRDKRL